MTGDIFIGADGTVQHVYSDDLAGLLQGEGEATTRRASHVEPYGSGWMADMRPVGGPVLYENGCSTNVDWAKVCDDDHGGIVPVPFATRAEALAAELEWLDKEMVSRQVTFTEKVEA